MVVRSLNSFTRVTAVIVHIRNDHQVAPVGDAVILFSRSRDKIHLKTPSPPRTTLRTRVVMMGCSACMRPTHQDFRWLFRLMVHLCYSLETHIFGCFLPFFLCGFFFFGFPANLDSRCQTFPQTMISYLGVCFPQD